MYGKWSLIVYYKGKNRPVHRTFETYQEALMWLMADAQVGTYNVSIVYTNPA